MTNTNIFPTHPDQPKQLLDENRRLKQALQESQKKIAELQAQYQALEEDYLHVLDSQQPPNLNGRKIAYVGASPELVKAYKAIVQHYHGELITPKSDQIEAVCEAIQQADEVICPDDCPNQALCHAARSSCTVFNKPLRTVENSSPQLLQEKLSHIEVEVAPS